MKLIAKFGEEEITYTKHNPIAQYGYILSPPYDSYGKKFAYNIVQLPDKSTGQYGKGQEIRIEAQWRGYSKLINKEKEDRWLFNVGNMWVNSAYPPGEEDNEFATALAISACNGESVFQMELDDEGRVIKQNGRVKMVAYPENYDTNLLNPNIHNWYHHPELFYKAYAIDENQKIRLVGQAYHIQIPRVKRTELWIPEFVQGRRMFVYFPPRDGGYILYGPEVYGADRTPLLTYVDGRRTFHNGFSLPGSKDIPLPEGWR